MENGTSYPKYSRLFALCKTGIYGLKGAKQKERMSRVVKSHSTTGVVQLSQNHPGLRHGRQFRAAKKVSLFWYVSLFGVSLL